jgi:hypothetical protein
VRILGVGNVMLKAAESKCGPSIKEYQNHNSTYTGLMLSSSFRRAMTSTREHDSRGWTAAGRLRVGKLKCIT